MSVGYISQVVAAVRPHGVDVSSGLETAPGVKDAWLMREFFAAVGAAEHPHEGVREGEKPQ